jgi:uncharacterized protein (DUF433 family)
MPAQAIIDNFEFGGEIGEIAEQFELPADSVRAIVTYAPDRRAPISGGALKRGAGWNPAGDW